LGLLVLVVACVGKGVPAGQDQGEIPGIPSSAAPGDRLDPVDVPSTTTFDAAYWLELQVECLRDKGWNAQFDPEGPSLIVPNVEGEQRLELVRASAECRTAVGVPEPAELTEREIRTRYERLIAVAACLEAEGYEVKPPPSFEVFLREWREGSPWHPYLSVPDDLSPGEWRRINRVCPQP